MSDLKDKNSTKRKKNPWWQKAIDKFLSFFKNGVSATIFVLSLVIPTANLDVPIPEAVISVLSGLIIVISILDTSVELFDGECNCNMSIFKDILSSVSGCFGGILN